MRNAAAALLPVCAFLLALPASALSDEPAGVAVSTSDAGNGRIVLYDRPIPVAALLGRADGAVVARGFAHREHTPRERAWGRLFAAWRSRGNGFPTTPPRPSGPAIPEPTAALVFAAGLLLVSRRRR